MGKQHDKPSNVDNDAQPSRDLAIRAGTLVAVITSSASHVQNQERKRRGERKQEAQRACGGIETEHAGTPRSTFGPTCSIHSAIAPALQDGRGSSLGVSRLRATDSVGVAMFEEELSALRGGRVRARCATTAPAYGRAPRHARSLLYIALSLSLIILPYSFASWRTR